MEAQALSTPCNIWCALSRSLPDSVSRLCLITHLRLHCLAPHHLSPSVSACARRLAQAQQASSGHGLAKVTELTGHPIFCRALFLLRVTQKQRSAAQRTARLRIQVNRDSRSDNLTSLAALAWPQRRLESVCDSAPHTARWASSGQQPASCAASAYGPAQAQRKTQGSCRRVQTLPSCRQARLHGCS